MKTTNNLLLDLARCLDQGIPDMDDSVLDVLNNISPIVEFPRPLDALNVSASADVHSETWHTSGFHSQVNGAGTNQQLGFCSKGLWRFDVILAMSSNYQVASLYPMSIQLIQSSGTVYLAGLVPSGAAAAPVSDNVNRSLLLLLPRNSELRAVSAGNAVGQILQASFDITCSRLL